MSDLSGGEPRASSTAREQCPQNKYVAGSPRANEIPTFKLCSLVETSS